MKMTPFSHRVVLVIVLGVYIWAVRCSQSGFAAPPPFPRDANGRLVMIKDSADSSLPSPVNVVTILHGRAIRSQHLFTLPHGVILTVSPSGKYLLWRYKGNDARGRSLHIVNTSHGETGTVSLIRPNDSIVSWSANGEAVLYRHVSPLGISYNIVHLPTTTAIPLPNTNQEEVQAVFWTQKGMDVVYSALPILVDRTVPLTSKWKSHLLLTRASVKNKCVFSPPQEVLPSGLDHLLGQSFLSLINFWEKENSAGYPANQYSFRNSRLISFNSDRTCALTYGEGVHKTSPSWSEPDSVMTYILQRGKFHRFATPNDEISGNVNWSADNSSFHYLSEPDEKWVRVTISTQKSERLAIPPAWGKIVQILP